MGQSHLEAARRPFAIADQQQGFFTANWIREHRGVYKMTRFPAAERPDLVLWSLWSRNRKEETAGVFSYQTALSIDGLSDVNPAKLHMTVPTRLRRNSALPRVLVLYYADLPAADVEERRGFRMTGPLRTIIDLIEAGTSERHFIRQAHYTSV